ncbi:2-hydroxyacid dehydrogenase [Actinophytocola gossypii]|uniref:D-glycerate dehydrogenase n=1 Tax=Actinophytocola gossypii TaxID=2812003 RepID=A0ABT2J2W4_9PSEU|nr:D-glycerate dehydrogenase [Actinophytocola gossypii]MCT2581845.1 D-glycerate dehydrogenase [Actinophytocola gossypii]
MNGPVVVTTTLPDPVLDRLRTAGPVWTPPDPGPLDRGALLTSVPGAAAIVATLNDRIDAEVADAAGPGLRVVANVAVGFDNLDVPALRARGVEVTNTPGVLTDATADLTFGLLLAVTRRLGEGERLLRARTPWSFQLGFMLGSGLQGKTLGIVGLGQIGRAVARRALAFGMRVVYTGRNPAPAPVERELSATRLPLADLLATADVVSLHCPLTEGTRHLIDADALATMKPTAFLVNTTRGPVVDEAALATALADGVIAGAALDVFEHEPDVHPGLLERDNVALAPHLGSATTETRTAMAMRAAENVCAVLAGAAPLTPVPIR